MSSNNQSHGVDLVALGISQYPEWEQQHILRVIINFNNLSSKRDQFKVIHDLVKNHAIQLTKLVKHFNVSISGYYKWLKTLKNNNICPIKQRNMDIIKKVYDEQPHHIGCRKIQKILETKYNIKLNYKTINNYMNKLSLLRDCDLCKREQKRKLLELNNQTDPNIKCDEDNHQL